MCGIFAYIARNRQLYDKIQKLKLNCEKIKHRGPDNTKYKIFDEKLFMGFHRLAINDISENGDQPLIFDDCVLICNGEIYNNKSLSDEFNIKTKGHSDCEIILHLYKIFGIHKTLELISGYFAFVLYDTTNDKIFVARDPIGVRALYVGEDSEGNIGVCSEMKGLHDIMVSIEQFKPGHYWDVSEAQPKSYYSYIYPRIAPTEITLEEQLVKMRGYFENAVFKRFMFERPFGVFLSGGFDSSIVGALVAKRNAPEPIHSFSIGMLGSTDLAKARIVANHIGSIHHEVIVTEDDMLFAIETVIKTIETYDTTTVRASTPMYLLSKYIKENTDIVVIFSGEGSDEASGSYMYFHNSPSDEAFQDECVRLLKDLSYFDCLRCDKSTAGNGLEVRVPFLDKEFILEYMKVPVEWKKPKDGMEKWFIRKAFENTGLLPDEILWRKKEAFSDGVSSTEKSWYQIIQDHIDKIITDEEYVNEKDKYDINPPKLKESYYYRKVFDRYYPGRASTIPYYWLPKWCGDTNDPSARVLKVYNKTDQL
jgi:asparagine synthase (glutamine-hydrolysing)